jgi:hypothetical protein
VHANQMARPRRQLARGTRAVVELTLFVLEEIALTFRVWKTLGVCPMDSFQIVWFFLTIFGYDSSGNHFLCERRKRFDDEQYLVGGLFIGVLIYVEVLFDLYFVRSFVLISSVPGVFRYRLFCDPPCLELYRAAALHFRYLRRVNRNGCNLSWLLPD